MSCHHLSILEVPRCPVCRDALFARAHVRLSDARSALENSDEGEAKAHLKVVGGILLLLLKYKEKR